MSPTALNYLLGYVGANNLDVVVYVQLLLPKHMMARQFGSLMRVLNVVQNIQWQSILLSANDDYATRIQILPCFQFLKIDFI